MFDSQIVYFAIRHPQSRSRSPFAQWLISGDWIHGLLIEHFHWQIGKTRDFARQISPSNGKILTRSLDFAIVIIQRRRCDSERESYLAIAMSDYAGIRKMP
jgi:hypothetical protein